MLLAYARWNKRIGYCQGFNVIAALLLNVMERKEDDALKVIQSPWLLGGWVGGWSLLWLGGGG